MHFFWKRTGQDMAQIDWKNTAGGDFNTGSNWSGGVVPGPADDAIINAATKSGYTVSASVSDTVNSIQTIALTTLAINGGTFTASSGSGTGANAGTIAVGNNTAFDAGGTLSNTGKVTLNSGGNVTSFVVGAANLTLSGGGSVALTDNGQNFIVGATAAATLTNVDNKISGAGTIGNGGMILVNQAKGVIDATGANALVLSATGGTATNGGELEGAGTGGLTIDGMTVINSSGGSLLGVSAVNLESATLIGGTLKTIGTGVIDTVDRGSLLDGTTTAVTNQGVLDISNNTSLNIQGTIANTGTIAMNSGGNVTQLVVTTKSATLSGGTVNLTDNSQNFILGTIIGPRGGQTVSTLTNSGVIQGGGNIGSNLVLTNTATIDATDGNNAIIIATGNVNVAGSNVVANSGTLESTNPGKLSGLGGLVLSGVTVVNSGTTGLILANGLHTHVDLQGATIRGGELDTLSGGVIQTAANDRGSLLDGVAAPVINEGALLINNNSSLTIQGSISNIGTISLASGGNVTQLVVSTKNATITGGAVNLSDNGQNFIVGTITGPRNGQTLSTLTNESVISGSGQIGADLLLNNTKTIDATGGSALNIVVGSTAVVGGSVVTNSSLLESTNPGLLTTVGGLVLNGVTISNSTTGFIEANGLHTHVDLESATIVAGALKDSGGGVIDTIDRGSVLSGLTGTVFNFATLDIINNTALTLRGNVSNHGTIALGSVGNTTDLIIGNNSLFPSKNNAVLESGGSVTLSDNGQNRIYGASVGSSLSNVDNTISGAGQLGDGELILINETKGVIDAVGNNALVLNVGATAVANSGLLEGSGAGGLTIQNSTVNNSTGGTIAANNGSFVNLQNADIIGGTLTVAGTGAFQTVDTNSLFNGQTSTINNEGLINILNNTALTLQGAINNTGAIALNSIGNFTDLIVDTTGATLSGKGTVTLSSNGENRIYGATTASTLTNVDNTIAGGGQIGAGQLTLINDAAGVINANSATGLVLNVGPAAVTNTGLIEATGAGGLTILNSTVNNSTGGTLLAGNGSSISLQNANLIGGTLKVSGTGFFQTTDSNSLLNGQTKAVTNDGVLNIDNNTDLTLQGSIINNKTGTIALNSGGNLTDLIIDTTGATISGGGNVTLSNNGNNIIVGNTASSVLTNVDNIISGSGQLGAGQLTLINQTKGVIDGTAPTTLTVDTGANTITNAGFIEADSGGATTVNSAVNNTGTLEANGGTLTLNGAVTGAGKAVITAGTLDITNANAAESVTFTGSTGTLELVHSLTYTGKVSGFTTTTGTAFDLRDISFNASTSTATYSGTASGGTLTVTNGTQTARIAMVGNYLSSTFTVGNDGGGGTVVEDPPKDAHAPTASSPHHFVAAMAGLGSGAGGAVHTTAEVWRASPSMLTAPRMHIA
jgi:hypothetical protein